MWRDPDRRTFQNQPEEYYSPFVWDGANQTVFRPISRFFAVDPAGEAINVNALDEVPDSSWFTNRLGRHGLTPNEAARGACVTPPIDPTKKIVVKSAKPNGFNPGFFIKTEDRRYLMKFDGNTEGVRPTAADVISTRIYHAVGYFVPCNRIVYFDRKVLEIDPEAESENERGEKTKLGPADVDKVFSKARRLPDGRYRASSSLFVEGTPLGPWTYEGTRSDDPNDVIAHEDRRELRGAEVLAAWLGYTDSREQNTMATFVEVGERGYVRHYMLDVGNTYGSVWEPPMLGRRIGHSYYFDVPYILEDFFTFGVIERPWDTLRFGPTGKVFGYYDVEHFDPDKFRPGYPNPAFVRKSERDSAWMARILARFTDDHLRAIVDKGDLPPAHERRLLAVLVGRRDKILRRYLTRLSPLAWPALRQAEKSAELCLEDMALVGRVANPGRRLYGVRAFAGEELEPTAVSGKLTLEDDRFVCLTLPAVRDASAKSPRYLIVDVFAGSQKTDQALPARVHLYHLGGSDYRIVGLERPDDADPPAT